VLCNDAQHVVRADLHLPACIGPHFILAQCQPAGARRSTPTLAVMQRVRPSIVAINFMAVVVPALAAFTASLLVGLYVVTASRGFVSELAAPVLHIFTVLVAFASICVGLAKLSKTWRLTFAIALLVGCVLMAPTTSCVPGQQEQQEC
jgi:hypothetical protein